MSQVLVLKILILGSDNVENYKIIADKYFKTDYKITVGVNVLSKTIPIDLNGKILNVTLSMWDISSKTKFDEIRKLFYKGGAGALFLFDLGKPSTWYHVIECYKEIETALTKVPFMIISSLPKGGAISVNEQEVKNWVKLKGGHYSQIDKSNMSQLESTFTNLVTEILSSDN
jgi:hypothetical protein